MMTIMKGSILALIIPFVHTLTTLRSERDEHVTRYHQAFDGSSSTTKRDEEEWPSLTRLKLAQKARKKTSLMSRNNGKNTPVAKDTPVLPNFFDPLPDPVLLQQHTQHDQVQKKKFIF